LIDHFVRPALKLSFVKSDARRLNKGDLVLKGAASSSPLKRRRITNPSLRRFEWYVIFEQAPKFLHSVASDVASAAHK
jgi:hypothetical protein